jgi:phosphatidate cytidylyltransferase
MGRDLLVLLLVVVWLGDSAAMYVGSLIGRHRLAPRISPGKSVEGAVAGGPRGIAGGTDRALLVVPSPAPGHALAIGALVGIARNRRGSRRIGAQARGGREGQLRLLPGHGGIPGPDRFAALCRPVLYYYYQALLR